MGETLWNLLIIAGAGAGFLAVLAKPKTIVFVVTLFFGAFLGTEILGFGLVGTLVGLAGGFMAASVITGAVLGVEELLRLSTRRYYEPLLSSPDQQLREEAHRLTRVANDETALRYAWFSILILGFIGLSAAWLIRTSL